MTLTVGELITFGALFLAAAIIALRLAPHIHRYQPVRATSGWCYVACRCGDRLVYRRDTAHSTPCDHQWVRTGVWAS